VPFFSDEQAFALRVRGPGRDHVVARWRRYLSTNSIYLLLTRRAIHRYTPHWRVNRRRTLRTRHCGACPIQPPFEGRRDSSRRDDIITGAAGRMGARRTAGQAGRQPYMPAWDSSLPATQRCIAACTLHSLYKWWANTDLTDWRYSPITPLTRLHNAPSSGTPYRYILLLRGRGGRASRLEQTHP